MRNLCLIISLFLSVYVASAQVDSTLLDRNFSFEDGIYFDLAALKTNQPDWQINVLDGDLVLSESSMKLVVETLFPKGRPNLAFGLDSIAAICLNGVPYIKVQREKENYAEYAGLQIRGRLSYYSYQEEVADSVLVKAYNPKTGRPFRQQKLSRPKDVTVDKVLDLVAGTIYDLDLAAAEIFFKEDEALLGSLRILSEEEAESRLQKCLMIFDDRHPIWLPEHTKAP